MIQAADETFTRDVCIVGGAGHVGLPLALTFAAAGLRTVVYDINASALETIASGVMPFREEGADALLQRVLASGRLELESTPQLLSECRNVVTIIGTPVDEHLNPDLRSIVTAIRECQPRFRNGQLLVLRSTVFPGMTEHVNQMLRATNLDIDVAFCPERVAQGHSLRELREIPQIVSGFSERGTRRARELFSTICHELIEMEPLEAELCKLMTNAWRYIQFAAVNQFYMLATEQGLDFNRILHGCRHNYPRMASMPGPGFAAGPCLVKDTMQLAAYSHNRFAIGHSAMLVNESMPRHLVDLAKRQIDLSHSTAGVLGMAFKAESDDPRDSLSYKLRKLLTVDANRVLCTDPYVRDPRLVPLETVLAESQVLFVATPHAAYREIEIPESTIVIDGWNHVSRRGKLACTHS